MSMKVLFNVKRNSIPGGEMSKRFYFGGGMLEKKLSLRPVSKRGRVEKDSISETGNVETYHILSKGILINVH